jgi:hypothetical protein
MRKIVDFIAFPFMPRPVVALADVNAKRAYIGIGKRNHNGRFIKPYRVR